MSSSSGHHPSNSSGSSVVIRFGEFEANLATGELRRGGAPVHLQDLPFRLLAALAERPGELVGRPELGARLWGDDTFVDFDAGLNTAVAKLREALGDSSEAPQFIETVPKRGYRFVAPVEQVAVSAMKGRSTRPDTRPWTPPDAAPSPAPPRPASGSRTRMALVAAAVVAMGALATFAALNGRGTHAPVRVAVVLFDNETGEADFDRVAQVLTDSVVVTLTSNERLAVIGNAAVLRSERPFRDLELIGDTLTADLIVIGQVQRVDNEVRVLTHLIRSSDQAHVWVQATPLTSAGENDLQAAVSRVIDDAVRSEVASPRVRQETK